ncbi:hypothetical protein ACFE04_012530 [Oxalis oulophora]
MNIAKSSSSSNSATSSSTLRISANLAAPPPPPQTNTNTNTNTNTSSSSNDDGQLRFICCEEIDGRRWNYVVAKVDVVAESVSTSLGKTKLFAQINSFTAAFILVGQLTLTGRILTTVGVTAAICAVPFVAFLNFFSIAVWPTWDAVAASEIVRKVVSYVVTRPGRELLFTVGSQEEKYKAKQSSSELYLLQQKESINWFLAKKEELLRPAAPSASTFLLRQGKRDRSTYLCKSSRLGASESEFQDPSSDRLGQSSSSYCSSCCRFHGLLLH